MSDVLGRVAVLKDCIGDENYMANHLRFSLHHRPYLLFLMSCVKIIYFSYCYQTAL